MSFRNGLQSNQDSVSTNLPTHFTPMNTKRSLSPYHPLSEWFQSEATYAIKAKCHPLTGVISGPLVLISCSSSTRISRCNIVLSHVCNIPSLLRCHVISFAFFSKLTVMGVISWASKCTRIMRKRRSALAMTPSFFTRLHKSKRRRLTGRRIYIYIYQTPSFPSSALLQSVLLFQLAATMSPNLSRPTRYVKVSVGSERRAQQRVLQALSCTLIVRARVWKWKHDSYMHLNSIWLESPGQWKSGACDFSECLENYINKSSHLLPKPKL